MSELKIEVYKKKNCGLCKDVSKIVTKVHTDIPFDLREVNIESSEELIRKYSDDVPTVFINGKKAFKFRLDEDQFRERVRKEIIKSGLNKFLDKKNAE